MRSVAASILPFQGKGQSPIGASACFLAPEGQIFDQIHAPAGDKHRGPKMQHEMIEQEKTGDGGNDPDGKCVGHGTGSSGWTRPGIAPTNRSGASQ